MTTVSSAAGAAFRGFHAVGELLVLPNAWDAASAALIEAGGARAIATTSAGMSWAHGYPDGERIPQAALLAAIAEILRVVAVPVSVDLEAGFSRSPDEVASLVLRVVELGAVGINLEDGTDPPDLLAAKIAAVKSALARAGRDVFVNARTDVFLRQLVPAEQALSEVLERGARYARAGADGLFVPRIVEPEAIRKITGAFALPVNVLAVPGLAPVAELCVLGVRRLSAGSAVAQLALASVQSAVERFLAEGRSADLFVTPAPPKGMNALLARP